MEPKRIRSLKLIDREYILRKGLEEAVEAKMRLWCTDFEGARNACAMQDNVWSAMRAAEVDLWILFSDESEENMGRAQTSMRECLDMSAFYAEQSAKPGFFSWGEHELGKMRPIIEAHAMSISAFATLGLAMLEFKQKSYVSGGYHLRSSVKSFEAARALHTDKTYPWPEDPVLTDITTFGLGFFALAVSLIPPQFLWLAEMVGFHADREEGIRKLNACWEAKGPSFIEAGLLVAMIRFFFLDDPDSAMAITAKLLEERPSSVYLCATQAGMHRVKGEVTQAVALMRRAVELSAKYPQMHLNQQYNLSDLYWFMGDYADAMPIQRAFLDGTKREFFRAFCGFKLLFGQWITKTGDATAMAQLARDVIEKYARDTESYDRFSARKCREFLARGNSFAPVEEFLIPAIWLCELKQYDLALTKCEHARKFANTTPLTQDEKAVLEYCTGVSQVGKKNYDVGETHLRDAVACAAPTETWVNPYCYSSLAQAELDRGRWKQCEEWLELSRSSAPEKFDFDGRHKIYIKYLDGQLKKKRDGK